MSSFAGVIAGLFAALLSIFGFHSAPAAQQLPPELPLDNASQTITEVTNIPVFNASAQSSSDQSAVSGQTGSVSGMSQYTDSDFGFSFWYPSDWLIRPASVQYPHDYSDGTIVNQLFMGVSSHYDVGIIPPSVMIYEVVSNGRSITFGTANGLVKHYFDTSLHTWMTEQSSSHDPATAVWNTPFAADVSHNTMGGLHMLSGPSSYAPVIIPLSASHFLVIEGSSADSTQAQAFAKTILATDPSVATPVSAAEQQATIQAEANAYGVSSVSGAMKTFTDDVHAFSVQYPASLTLGGNENLWGGLSGKVAENPFTIVSGPVALSITVSADPTDVGNCTVTPQSSEDSVADASTVTINGVPFRTYTTGDAATGHYTSIQIYKTIKNNACYELTEQTDTSRTESDAEAKAQQDSVAAGKAHIDPIVQSFTFTRDLSTAPAPTCALSSDKIIYKLGDVVTLSWSSKNARRALWAQDPVQNTGVRTVIIPPAGVPDTNGSGPTVANIEGYQPITLQVVGDGGYGVCSTNIDVTHSDAKPSVTVDSVGVSKKTDYTNDRNVEVTVSGTATNGGLFNNEVNIVLFDPAYAGPFDENSVYSADRKYFYSGGTQPGVREDNLPFNAWSAESYVPRTVTSVRVLAYYPFYGSGPYDASIQPIVNEVLTVQP